MREHFFTIQQLQHVYNQHTVGEVVALNDMSFSVSEGEWVTIVGSNAAGKTTLFNAIAGSIVPTAGDIMLSGVSLMEQSECTRSGQIARVRQHPHDSVFSSLTLAENLAMARMRGSIIGLKKGVTKEWYEECRVLLKPLGLGLEMRLNDKIDLLSGGQKQAVALVMATIAKPKLLLLDEHASALDPNMSAKILDMTEHLVREYGITTLMITHNIHHAITYGDRLVVLDRGRILFEATGEEKRALTVADVVERMERGV